MKPQTTLRNALTDPLLLGNVLGGPSWAAWRTVLLAARGEPLTDEEREAFAKLTGGRTDPPPQPVEELWAVVGRRGGKSSAIAALACYLGALCDWRDVLAPGERGVVLCIAPDQRQARILLDYAEGAMRASPLLAQMIEQRTADTLELDNGIVIEVRSASYRRIRGLTCVAVVCDEAAFWLSEATANPDVEILNAARPMLATTNGMLVVISSPYAKRGAVWNAYRQHFAVSGSPVLVVQGASRDFNPSLPVAVVDRALERDPESAAAEFLACFRSDVESFVDEQIVRACIRAGVKLREPERRWRYAAFVDPSGGSSDSMTLAIAHVEGERQARTAILDLAIERRAPFSPEAVVEEMAEACKRYRVTKVVGDRYGGQWPADAFRKNGINYQPSERTKSEIYLDLLPHLTSRAVDLLDSDVLVRQLVGLERKTSRGGRDSIDHRVGLKDDVANAAAGVLVEAMTKRRASNEGRQDVRVEGLSGFNPHTFAQTR